MDKPIGRARGRSARSISQTPQNVQPVLGASNPVKSATGDHSSNVKTSVAVGRAGIRGGPGDPTTLLTDDLRKASLRISGREQSTSKYDVMNLRTALKKTGSAGTPIQLKANYFQVKFPEIWSYLYTVNFEPDLQAKSLRKALLFSQLKDVALSSAFDGAQLFSTIKLPEETTVYHARTKNDDTEVKITVTRRLELHPYNAQSIHMVNVIKRQMLTKMGLEEVGRNVYNPKLKVLVENHKMEIWPGYTTSILPYEGNILMNVEISHKLMRMDSVLHLYYNILQKNNRDYARTQNEFTQEVVGSIVLTRYNNKTYKVDDIMWENPCSFDVKGKPVTFVEYYKKHYQIDIKEPDQPLLISNPKRKDIKVGRTGPVLLFPELCFLTGLSDKMRSDFRVMKDLQVHTRQGPNDKIRKYREFRKAMKDNPEVVKDLQKWSIDFSNDLVDIVGRKLDNEKIIFSSKRNSFPDEKKSVAYNKPDEADWSMSMRNCFMMQAINLDNWVFMYTKRDGNDAEVYLNDLKGVARPLGMNISEPTKVVLENDRTDVFMQKLRGNVNGNTKFIHCIVPNNRKDRYDSIKKFCCIDIGVPSQVAVTRTINDVRKRKSVATKIAIQINCKLGGSVWGVEIPIKTAMIIGFDTYHDAAKKGRSVGAFVATYDQFCTKYYSKILFNAAQQEFGDGLTRCLNAALRNYHDARKSLPTTIIIYRDGVGDGQIQMVVEHEIPQLKAAFENYTSNYNPTMAYVIVKKNINSKFMDARNFNNPPPGTVIDTVVTKEQWNDFFLVSQNVRQGTVTPTHYNVIENTTHLDGDKQQRLAYKFTHLYYNWQGTVRVPAPCQYAHKLAYLVGQSLHKEPAAQLENKFYYL